MNLPPPRLLPMTAQWVTRAEAAEMLSCTAQTVDRHAGAGRLPRYRVGGQRAVRFRVEDIRALYRLDTTADGPA